MKKTKILMKHSRFFATYQKSGVSFAAVPLLGPEKPAQETNRIDTHASQRGIYFCFVSACASLKFSGSKSAKTSVGKRPILVAPTLLRKKSESLLGRKAIQNNKKESENANNYFISSSIAFKRVISSR